MQILALSYVVTKRKIIVIRFIRCCNVPKVTKRVVLYCIAVCHHFTANISVCYIFITRLLGNHCLLKWLLKWLLFVSLWLHPLLRLHCVRSEPSHWHWEWTRVAWPQWTGQKSVLTLSINYLLAHDTLLLPWCSSVCLSGKGIHCDHTVHFSADLSLWLDSPMFWAPWHQSMSTYSRLSFFVFHLEESTHIVHSSSCLNYLLPEQRDFVNIFHHSNKYELFLARTERYCNSCIQYCVSKFRQ